MLKYLFNPNYAIDQYILLTNIRFIVIMYDKGLTMYMIYGARDIVRNPSLLKIKNDDGFIVEDKRTRKQLGVYLGLELAKEFFEYRDKQQLLKSARKIKQSALAENIELD